MRKKPGIYRTPMSFFTRMFLVLFMSAVLWFLLYLLFADWSVLTNYYKYLGM